MRDHAGPLSASNLLTYNMSDLEMATHAMAQARKMGEVGWGELKWWAYQIWKVCGFIMKKKSAQN